MPTITVTNAWQEKTIATDVSVAEISGKLFIAPSGTTNQNAGVRFKGAKFFPAGTYAMRGPGQCVTTPYAELNAPVPFAVADWSIADSATVNALDLTIVSVPSPGGYALSGFEWSKDAGTNWTAITRKTAGVEALPCGSVGAKNIILRQITEQGASIKSDTKTATVA